MTRSKTFGTVAAALFLCLVGLATLKVGAAETVKPKHAQSLWMRPAAHLGVSLEDVGPDDVSRLKLDAERGVIVTDAKPDGPAGKAGIKEGDVIVRFQGETVQSAAQLARLVGETPAGRTVSIEVLRDGESKTVSATLDERRGALARGFDVPMPPTSRPLPTWIGRRWPGRRAPWSAATDWSRGGRAWGSRSRSSRASLPVTSRCRASRGSSFRASRREPGRGGRAPGRRRHPEDRRSRGARSRRSPGRGLPCRRRERACRNRATRGAGRGSVGQDAR